jgi:hypothetical protein
MTGLRAASVYWVAFALLVGCATGEPDPLLFDEAGGARLSVDIDEIIEAGIQLDCDDLIESGEDLGSSVRVPVEGTEEELVLVGLAGAAMCVESSPPELPSYEVDEQTGLPDGQAVQQQSQGGDSEGLSNVLPNFDPHVAGEGAFGSGGYPKGGANDPTPEPIIR